MTLRELIARHESAQPAPVTVTPRGAAEVAARRLHRALTVLNDPNVRTAVLFTLVHGFTDPDGHCYSLMVSHPPTLDPQIA